jgi:hypothetical protein
MLVPRVALGDLDCQPLLLLFGPARQWIVRRPRLRYGVLCERVVVHGLNGRGWWSAAVGSQVGGVGGVVGVGDLGSGVGGLQLNVQLGHDV